MERGGLKRVPCDPLSGIAAELFYDPSQGMNDDQNRTVRAEGKASCCDWTAENKPINILGG